MGNTAAASTDPNILFSPVTFSFNAAGQPQSLRYFPESLSMRFITLGLGITDDGNSIIDLSGLKYSLGMGCKSFTKFEHVFPLTKLGRVEHTKTKLKGGLNCPLNHGSGNFSLGLTTKLKGSEVSDIAVAAAIQLNY